MRAWTLRALGADSDPALPRRFRTVRSPSAHRIGAVVLSRLSACRDQFRLAGDRKSVSPRDRHGCWSRCEDRGKSHPDPTTGDHRVSDRYLFLLRRGHGHQPVRDEKRNPKQRRARTIFRDVSETLCRRMCGGRWRVWAISIAVTPSAAPTCPVSSDRFGSGCISAVALVFRSGR